MDRSSLTVRQSRALMPPLSGSSFNCGLRPLSQGASPGIAAISPALPRDLAFGSSLFSGVTFNPFCCRFTAARAACSLAQIRRQPFGTASRWSMPTSESLLPPPPLTLHAEIAEGLCSHRVQSFSNRKGRGGFTDNRIRVGDPFGPCPVFVGSKQMSAVPTACGRM